MARFQTAGLVVALATVSLILGCDNGPVEDLPLITATEPGRSVPLGDPANLGEQRTAVILATFTDLLEPTREPEIYQEAVFDGPSSVSAFIEEASYGKTWLTGDVFGWYRANEPSDCNYDVLTRQILDAADADVHYPDYSRLILISPQRAVGTYCFESGNGTIGKVQVETGDGTIEASITHVTWEGYISLALRPPARIVAHELLHNFGMWHENGYGCGVRTILLIGGCRNDEYGNPFSALGKHRHGFHPSAFAKEFFGWLPEAQILTATQSGRYVIYPLQVPDGNAKAVRIPLDNPITIERQGATAEATEYYLEYRRQFGFDAVDNDHGTSTVDLDGALLYTWAAVDSRKETKFRDFVPVREGDKQVVTLLLDTSPGSKTNGGTGETDFSDGMVPIGGAYHDEPNGITIEPLRTRSDGGLEIRISFQN